MALLDNLKKFFIKGTSEEKKTEISEKVDLKSLPKEENEKEKENLEEKIERAKEHAEKEKLKRRVLSKINYIDFAPGMNQYEGMDPVAYEYSGRVGDFFINHTGSDNVICVSKAGYFSNERIATFGFKEGKRAIVEIDETVMKEEELYKKIDEMFDTIEGFNEYYEKATKGKNANIEK